MYHRQFILRKYLNMSSADLRSIEVEDVSRFLEWHEDETIQSRIDQYGASGTDITKPESGTGSQFYRKWMEKQRAKYEEQEAEDIFDEEEIRKKAVIYRFEIDKVMGRRALKPEISGKIK